MAILMAGLGSPDFTVGAATQGADANEAMVAHSHFSTLGVVLQDQSIETFLLKADQGSQRFPEKAVKTMKTFKRVSKAGNLCKGRSKLC